MKISSNTASYNTTIAKAADFGIQNEDLSHIMGILRSQIYSDKLLAVIREYSTNARDANIEAGKDTHITVNLPTFATPELSFRDYGNGLTDEEVCDLYVKYGASTKRDSNDYTGCLGIGCKAAFAYGDTFTIISFTEYGVTEWLARIDESKKGTISLLSQRDRLPDEPTGVRINVHIRKQDLDDCVKKAQNFFKYWSESEVEIRNSESGELEDEITHLEYIVNNDTWALIDSDPSASGYYRSRQYNSEATLLMGHIAYPLDINQLDTTNPLLTNSNVILKAPLGSVDIAANRESLEYTDKTKAAITALGHDMFIELTQEVENRIASQDTRLKASKTAHVFRDILGDSLNGQLVKSAKWKNKPLLHKITFNADTTRHYKKKSWQTNDIRNAKDNGVRTITLNSKRTHLVLWDSDTISITNATRRIRTLQENRDNHPEDAFYVIEKKNLSLVEPKLESSDYTNLDHIQPLKPKRTIITNTDGTKTKSVKISVCHLKPARLKSDRLTAEAEPVTNSEGKYIYVPLDRYDWVGRADALDNLQWLINALHFLTDTDTHEVIHGVKKHYLNKLDDKWIKLDDYLKDLWTRWKKNNSKHYNSLMQSADPIDHDQRWHASEILSLVDDPTVSYIAKVCIMKEHCDKDITGANNPKLRSTFDTMSWLGLIDEPTGSLNKAITVINDKYPLLKEIQDVTWSSRMDAQSMARELNKYINYCKQS